MATHVVLLRGINVGGNHRLAMAEVRRVLGAAGFGRVETLIQSGNIVLDAPGALHSPTEVATVVQRELEALAGFPIPTVALGAEEFRAVLAANPFRPSQPKLEHVVLLGSPLDDQRRARLAALAEKAAADGSPDELAVAGQAVYLHHPGGLAGSKLAATVMGQLRDGTARNLATMARIAAMLDPSLRLPEPGTSADPGQTEK